MFTKFKQAAQCLMEPVHIVLAAVYTVLATVLLVVLVRLLFALLFPFMYLGSRTGYDSIVSRFPVCFLIGGVAVVSFFAAQRGLPFGPGTLQILAGTVFWLFALYTVISAYHAASEVPPRFDQYEATIASRWPDRWCTHRA